MKPLLLHPDNDFQPAPDLADEVFGAIRSGSVTELARVKQEYGRRHSGAEPPLPPIRAMLADDLKLATLWNTMGGGDEFVYETVRRVMLSSEQDPGVIRYRQAVLSDCLEQPDVIRELYEMTLDGLRNVRRGGASYTGAGPNYRLARNVALLLRQVAILRQIRQLCDVHAERFRSAGMRRFATTVTTELEESYLSGLEAMLGELQFRNGLHVSAGLDAEDTTAAFIVHRPSRTAVSSWTGRLAGRRRDPSAVTFELDPSDDDSRQELQWLRGKALAQIADVAAHSAAHIQAFLAGLRLELAFYLGAINLHSDLRRKGAPLCFPEPLAPDLFGLRAEDLREACLSLRSGQPVVGNDILADGKALIIITGANQGGKSTALRSLGVAQLMMQAGMFVAARRYRASVSTGLYTHYRRQEDINLDSGKLEEELSRMSELVAVIGRGAILLCNESFAATNEREGSEIARQVVSAMLAKGIRVVFVTHLYEFALHFHDQQLPGALFLRPERDADGRRSFRLLEGEPLPTSYGRDSFHRIFQRS